MSLSQWILNDLTASGLTVDDINIVELTDEDHLNTYLGYTVWEGQNILAVGGYFIHYPGTDFYRLKLKTPIGDAKYLSPKGRGNRAFIHPSISKIAKDYNPSRPLFFDEGEKKAAKGTIEGFPTIGFSGVWNFKNKDGPISDLDSLCLTDRRVYIPFDSDANRKLGVMDAGMTLAVEILNRGGQPFWIELPDGPNGEKTGLDDFLVREGAEAFQKLVDKASASCALDYFISKVQSTTDPVYKKLIKRGAQIQAPTTRGELVKKLSMKLKIRSALIEMDLRQAGDEDNPTKSDGTPDDKFTAEDLAAGLELLNAPDILGRMCEFTAKAGYVGEDINKRLVYLAGTSRLFDDALSCVVKGSSASGKSTLVRSILSLFPRSVYLDYSRITTMALYHIKGLDLSHRIMFVQERAGGEESDYAIRTALSEGDLSLLIPTKDEKTGDFTTVEKRIPAQGLVYFETTTKDRIHAENETRVLDLYTDDSAEQTARVLEAATVSVDKGALEKERGAWQAAQSLLKPYPVLIPFAKELAAVFPKNQVRARRDFRKLLTLIKAHALLYQSQREIVPGVAGQTLVATRADFEGVRDLGQRVLDQSMRGLTPKQEEVLKTIQATFPVGEDFSLADLNKAMGGRINIRTLERALAHFKDEGIVDWNGKKSRESRYSRIGDIGDIWRQTSVSPNMFNESSSLCDSRHSDTGDIGNGSHDGDNPLCNTCRERHSQDAECPTDRKDSKNSLAGSNGKVNGSGSFAGSECLPKLDTEEIPYY